MSASVRRETLAETLERFGVAEDAAFHYEGLIAALAAEPDPPTTIREPAAVLEQHVADSLAGLGVPALAEALTLADVGAGAGFPGLALAIARPGMRVDLIEAAGRKCEVIERLAAAGGATNARAVPARAEAWGAGEGAGAYDAVAVRAVAPLAVLCEYAAPLLQPGGALVAWKGARDAREEAAGASAAAALGLRPLEVRAVEPFPGAHSRHLHVFAKVDGTPPRFPRRVGVAAKRPLG